MWFLLWTNWKKEKSKEKAPTLWHSDRSCFSDHALFHLTRRLPCCLRALGTNPGFPLGCSQRSTHRHVEPWLALKRMPTAFVQEGHPTRAPLSASWRWDDGLPHVYTPACSVLYLASYLCNNQTSLWRTGIKPYPLLPFHVWIQHLLLFDVTVFHTWSERISVFYPRHL